MKKRLRGYCPMRYGCHVHRLALERVEKRDVYEEASIPWMVVVVVKAQTMTPKTTRVMSPMRAHLVGLPARRWSSGG
jgi:hypothetical protein